MSEQPQLQDKEQELPQDKEQESLQDKEKENTQKQEQDQPDNEYITLPIPGHGDVNFTGREVAELAIFGYNNLLKQKQESDNKGKETNSEPDDKVARLEAELADLKRSTTERTETENIRAMTQNAINSYEETKSDPELAEGVAIEALARISMNPRLDFNKTFKQVLEQRKKMIDKLSKNKANNAMERSLNSTVRSVGSTPPLDTSKEFKREDVRSGAARRAMQEFLDRSR